VSCHARAHACRVSIPIGDELEPEILGDGIGLPQDPRAGVGLSSMRGRLPSSAGRAAEPLGPAGGPPCARLRTAARFQGAAMSPIRILVADDGALFRGGWGALLLSVPGLGYEAAWARPTARVGRR
jgi:hypothetical protein